MQDEPYELGPDLLAAQKLPLKAVPSGMALEGESGPDPAKFDIMNADDFGIWQNRTMKHSDTALAEQSTIPGYASLLAAEATPLAPAIFVPAMSELTKNQEAAGDDAKVF